jgi:hypothetical protein
MLIGGEVLRTFFSILINFFVVLKQSSQQQQAK